MFWTSLEINTTILTAGLCDGNGATEVRAECFRTGRAKSYVNIMQLFTARYRWGNMLWISVVGVAVTKDCNCRPSTPVFSALCDSCSTLNLHRFVINLRKLHCDTFQMHENAFRDDAMSRTITCERYLRLKCGQTWVGDFERVGRPLSSWNDDNTAAVH